VQRGLFEILESIERKEDHIMAAIDDLNAAVTALQTEATAVETAVSDLVAAVAAAGATTPEIEAAVSNITAVTAGLTTAAGSDPGPQPAPAS
jgi:ABC-type transporter Mla subunit MlaD